MNNFDNIRKLCRPVRMSAGVALIAIAVMTGNAWFYLGILPLIAGAVNFCPLCMITKKCSI